MTSSNMPRDASSGYILDDLPADEDALDFSPYVATLADIIASPSTRTPLTIGVFGTWGSSKTSLMRMIRQQLPAAFQVAWFDAWKYEKEEALWRALLLQVLTALRAAIPADGSEPSKKALAELSDMETTLYRAVDCEEVGRVTIDWDKLVKGSIVGLTHLSLSVLPGVGPALSKLLETAQGKITGDDLSTIFEAIERERSKIHIEQVQFLDQFHHRFRDLVNKYVRQMDDKKKAEGRLVVFIDDLDRCLPEKAVEVLEAIKLFVDAPGCVFVLGLDQAVIARGIEIKYREFEPELAEGGDGASRRRSIIDGARYLEKIIQLPFQIPPIERSDMGAFVQALVTEWPHAACPEVFAEGLGQNPRQVKRTVNVFLLLWQLAGRRQEKLQDRIKPIRLAKVVAIQHIYPELYDLLKTTPRLLRELEDYYRAEAARTAQPAAPPGVEKEAAQETADRLEPPPALAPFVSRAAVRRVLTMHPADLPEANFSDLPPDELRLYFTLTRRAEAPQLAPPEVARAFIEPQLVRVPTGSFLMGSTEEQVKQAVAKGLSKDFAKAEQPQHSGELPDYFIGKYPVTNAEYRAFVRETGHSSPRHWDGESYPDEKGDHPVVNVSWRDATAYCQWLSEKTGKLYRLPTEAEWEKAARGADGRLYPWGNDWDPARLNSAEGGAGDTTPVGQYSPAGDSPDGAADMAGNVWEWTLSLFKSYPYDSGDGREELEGDGLRVLRGGSFGYNDRWAVRCAARYWDGPDFKDGFVGFRVAVVGVSSN